MFLSIFKAYYNNACGMKDLPRFGGCQIIFVRINKDLSN